MYHIGLSLRYSRLKYTTTLEIYRNLLNSQSKQ